MSCISREFARRALLLTHSSWFKVPEFNMSSYDVLSHGSCFLMRLPKNPSCWMIGAGHVSYPFKFPGLYPQQDWLSHVKEKHKYDLLELRDLNTGDIVKTFRVEPRALHKTRDLVVATLQHQEQLAEIEKLTKEYGTYIEPNCSSIKLNDRVIFAGYTVENSGMENEVHKTQITEGTINLVGEKRCFAKTDDSLEMGMCGGAVLNSKGECIGVLEGVVNPPSEGQNKETRAVSEQFGGSALFVPINEALNLIDPF